MAPLTRNPRTNKKRPGVGRSPVVFPAGAVTGTTNELFSNDKRAPLPMETCELTENFGLNKRRKKNRSKKIRLQIPFHDVDSLGVVWHGHYFKYFELARTAFFRRVGFDFHEMQKTGYVWPLIDAQCRYVAPLLYAMECEIVAELVDKEHRLKFVYTIFDRKTKKRLAYGHTVQAAVNRKTGRLSLTTPPILLRYLSR